MSESPKGAPMHVTMLTLLATILGQLLVGPAQAQRSGPVTPTDADVLKQKLDRGEKVLVIDVRDDDEVRSGSIPGAVHIPLEQLEQRMKDIPRNVQLVFT